MKINQFNITLVGGGMVGMSLALMVAQQHPNASVALIDAHTFPDHIDAEFFQPSFDARSTAIAQGSVEIFEKLGIWKNLQQQATAISQIHVSDAGHFMGGVINSQDYAVDAVGYVVPNQWLGHVLVNALRNYSNIHLLQETRVERIIPKQEKVTLELTHNNSAQNIETSLLVLADGGPSKLAQQLGIEFSIEDYQQSAIITNVEFSSAHQGIAYERFTESGPIALLPLGKQTSASRSALVFTSPTDMATELFHADESVFLKELQKRFGSRVGNFLRCSHRHLYDLKLVKAQEQIRSRVVLLGNAAHFLHPVAGQGFNLSLRDCAALSQVLTQNNMNDWGQLSQLQQYLALQKKDQQNTIFFSDQLVKLFSSSQLPAIALRHLGFMGLESLSPLKNMLVKQTMGKTA